MPTDSTPAATDGREYTRSQPGLAIWRGVCIDFAVLALNISGDVLRDLIDPPLLGGRR